jgi:hypothetical protein
VPQTVDADERRARRTRLIIIILAVVGVLVTAGLVWRRLTDRAVNSKADRVIADLRDKWRPVDLNELQDDYSLAATAANDTGDYDQAYSLLPQPGDADFFNGGFVRGGAFEASYNVSAGWGGHRCIQIRVVGPPPNQVAFQEHNGEC